MSALSFLGLAAGVFVLLLLLRPVIYSYSLLKALYRRPKYAIVDEGEVSADVRDYLSAGAESLLALGFSPLTWVRYETLEYSEHGYSFFLVLVHEATGARAWVNPSSLGPWLRVCFSAEFEDGTRLESADGESKLMVAPIEGAEIVDPSSSDSGALWAAFSARLAELSRDRRVVRRDPLDLAAATQAWLARVIDRWLEAGVLQPGREAGTFELTWRRALQMAWRIAPAMAAHAKFRAARAKSEPAEFPLSELVRMYRRVREFVERRSSRFGIGSVFLVSGLLFGLSMLRLFDVVDLGLLLIVVLLHEYGHYFAMRAFGYRDTSIFFIPFFGAAARGIKRDARISEQVVVLLAGPMPGIALAAAITFAAPGLLANEHVRTLLDLLVIVNVLNLFPIFPFDGGRVVQTILGNAGPIAEISVRLVGVATMLGLGLFSQDALLIALAVVIGIGIPAAKRAAVAVRRIRARGPVPQQEDEQLALVFEELRTNQPSLPPANRLAVALPVAQRLRQAQLGALRSAGWGGAYVGCLTAGLFAFSFVSLGSAYRSGRTAYEPLACDEVDAAAESMQSGPGRFSFRCTMDDEQEAAALAETIEAFVRVPDEACLKAPLALLGAMGRSASDCENPDPRVTTVARARDDIVFVRGARSDLRTGVADLAGYLCSRGCALHYRARPRSAPSED